MSAVNERAAGRGRRGSGRLHRMAMALLLALMLPTFSNVADAREIETVGIIVADLGNAFFEQLARDVETAARTEIGPSVAVTVRSSGYDLKRQIAQVNAMTAAGVDLLILSAVDTEGIGPAVRNARANGVIVVAIDVRADGAQATVTSDNRGAGQIACRYLAERLNGKGHIFILNGPPVSAVMDRVSGCREVLASYTGIVILPDDENTGGSIEGAVAQMTDVLTRYPRIDAIFAINDPTAFGADMAASRAGRSEFFIVSIDGSPLGTTLLRRKGTTLSATVVQSPRQMSRRAIEFGKAIHAGDGVGIGEVKTTVSLLTARGLGAYSGWWR